MNTLQRPMSELPSRAEVEAHAERAAREAVPWIERLGRVGHAAHGAVYGTVGLLAAQAAFGVGGAATDPEGVFDWLLEASFGRVLLILMAIALIGYALWRFVQTVRDPDRKGTSPGGIAARVGYAGSGIAYLGLALSGLQLSLGARAPSDHDPVHHWTGQVLSAPLGDALVAVAGVVVLGVAGAQAVMAYRADFCRNLKTEQMSASLERWVIGLGRVGYAARAVIFALVGAFLIHAAVERDPGLAHGIGESLSILASQPYGMSLLALVALGLLAYGAFEMMEARYRRMQAQQGLY